MIYVISGPSGVGKTTIIAEIIRRNPSIQLLVSATTREPKKGEKNGVHYYFINRRKFQQWKAGGRFLECAEIHGHLYGTLWSEFSLKNKFKSAVVLEIDCQGMFNIKRQYPNAITIFIEPLSFEILEGRIRHRSRGEDEEEIVQRLQTARAELEVTDQFDFRIVNDEFEVAIGEILKIMTSNNR